MRILKFASFATALAAAVAVHAADVDLTEVGDQTVTGNSSDNYTTSGEEMRTLTFGPSAKRFYSGIISGNTHVKITPYKGASPAEKNVTFSEGVHSYTGGTELNGLLMFSKADNRLGFQPIVINNTDDNYKGIIRLSYQGACLSNNLVFCGSANSGYGGKFSNLVALRTDGKANLISYSGSITATNCGAISFYNGLELRASYLKFLGNVNATNTDLYVSGVTNATVYFVKDVVAKDIHCAFVSNNVRGVTLRVDKKFNVGTINFAGGKFDVYGTLGAATVINWTAATDGVTESIDAALDARDDLPVVGLVELNANQSIDCLTSIALTSEQAAKPGMALTGEGKKLTLGCTRADAACYAKINGSVDLVLNAAESTNVQGFYGRVNETTGSLGISNGVFKVGAGASFPNVAAIAVEDGGTLELAAGLQNPLNRAATLYLNGGAKLIVPAGSKLTLFGLYIDGVKKSASDVKVDGEFVLDDDPSVIKLTEATWSGAGADTKTSTQANWGDGKNPVQELGYQLTATFAAGGSAAEVTAGFTFKTLIFDLANDFAFSGEPVKIGADGLDFAKADDVAERTVTFAQPVSVDAAQTWFLGTNKTLRLEGGLAGAKDLVVDSEQSVGGVSQYGTRAFVVGGGEQDFTGKLFVTNGVELATCGIGATFGKEVVYRGIGNGAAFTAGENTSNVFVKTFSYGNVKTGSYNPTALFDCRAGSYTSMKGNLSQSTSNTKLSLAEGAVFEMNKSLWSSTTFSSVGAGTLVLKNDTGSRAYEWKIGHALTRMEADNVIDMNNEKSNVAVTLQNGAKLDLGTTTQHLRSLQGAGSVTGDVGSVVRPYTYPTFVDNNVNCALVFEGAVSYSPTNGTFTLTGVSTSTGTLASVASAKVTLAPGAYWAGDLEVGGEGTLVVSPKTTARTATLTVTTGGKIELSGTLRVAKLIVDGVEQSIGWYTAATCGWLTGTGKIAVGQPGGVFIAR